MHGRLVFGLAILPFLGWSFLGCTESVTVPMDPGPPRPIIEHVAKQEILTPLPIRVRLPASYGVEHVLVLVLPWGLRHWEIVELDRYGQTWSGEVSCRQVSTITGDTRYFFLALDSAGEIVADSGSPDWPHVATIVQALPEGPRGLAGAPPPRRCHDPADCPPDFPGCPAYTVLRPACSSHEECESEVCAWDGYCEPGAPAYEDEWEASSDEASLARAVRNAQRRFKIAKGIRSSKAE
jgi:hypothetical protein